MDQLIDGRQKGFLRIIETVFTIAGWAYMLLFILQFTITLGLWLFNLHSLAGGLFSISNLMDTLKVVLITLIAGMLGVLIIHSWSIYNMRRFSGLRRRQFPQSVTEEQLAEHFGLSVDEVRTFQQSKVLELDRTII